MKKIMFDDRFGLTQAVLDGRKTMTRRIAKIKERPCPDSGCLYCWHRDHDKGCEWILEHSRFKPGEVVAVAQSYLKAKVWSAPEQPRSAWDNKMFVRADLMPHQIRITSIKVERLQDISDEECLREGVRFYNCGIDYGYRIEGIRGTFSTARDAFAALIDKVSGSGTWKSNPWVFVYEFELIR